MNDPRTENHPTMGMDPPQKGDVFRCDVCGMEIQVRKECHCENMDEGPHFSCCGRELTKSE